MATASGLAAAAIGGFCLGKNWKKIRKGVQELVGMLLDIDDSDNDNAPFPFTL
jgi:hypothetical protein